MFDFLTPQKKPNFKNMEVDILKLNILNQLVTNFLLLIEEENVKIFIKEKKTMVFEILL